MMNVFGPIGNFGSCCGYLKLGLGTVEADVYCCTPTRVVIDSTSKIKEARHGAAGTLDSSLRSSRGIGASCPSLGDDAYSSSFL